MTKANPYADCRSCFATFLKPRKRSVFCSPMCAVMHKTAVRTTDECWPWEGTIKSNGYGVLSYNGQFKHPHRLMLESTLGRSLLPTEDTRHTCDNRRCVNPNHLRVGSRSDNMRDAVKRNRLHPTPPHRPGSQHGQSKLTELAVGIIRNSPLHDGMLAQQFGVSQKTIAKVRARRSWTHI